MQGSVAEVAILRLNDLIVELHIIIWANLFTLRNLFHSENDGLTTAVFTLVKCCFLRTQVIMKIYANF